jgi:hypothetical protein
VVNIYVRMYVNVRVMRWKEGCVYIIIHIHIDPCCMLHVLTRKGRWLAMTIKSKKDTNPAEAAGEPACTPRTL